MSNPVFEFLNGKHYVLNGVSGTFKHEEFQCRYPYPHIRETLSHNPDEEGRKSQHYQETKRSLGDHWSSDLTQDIDRYCDIALELGYVNIAYERLEDTSFLDLNY